ncbi:PTS lactose transporter subunit IIC [Rhodobacteraceae bacterium CCMM004]|nr:PTS lactose transporter subunit IIC [Rhodobacteraceae bacterium CCMM004]
MNLSKLLTPDAVRITSGTTSKKRLFHELADTAQSVYGLESGAVVEALLDREALGPTGVGAGVALPHARLRGIDKVRGLFLRSERPIDYGAVDRQPVDLVFCLFAPDAAGVEHLKALASVSRTLRKGDLCSKLRANEDSATLYAILTAENETRAA